MAACRWRTPLALHVLVPAPAFHLLPASHQASLCSLHTKPLFSPKKRCDQHACHIWALPRMSLVLQASAGTITEEPSWPPTPCLDRGTQPPTALPGMLPAGGGRHSLLPGITGQAQAHGPPEETPASLTAVPLVGPGRPPPLRLPYRLPHPSLPVHSSLPILSAHPWQGLVSGCSC